MDYPFPNVDSAEDYTQHVAVTPSDSTQLPSFTRALYVGGVGDITATLGGVDGFYKEVPAGTILKGRFTYVKQTGTTATYIIARG